MFWKAEYSTWRIPADTSEGKDKILAIVLKTLRTFPYATAHLFKFSGEEKIYVDSYGYDLDAWNNKGISRLKRPDVITHYIHMTKKVQNFVDRSTWFQVFSGEVMDENYQVYSEKEIIQYMNHGTLKYR